MDKSPGSEAHNTTKQDRLDQHPLAAALDEFVKHETYISERETANVEAEELGCVSSAQLQAYVGRRGVP